MYVWVTPFPQPLVSHDKEEKNESVTEKTLYIQWVEKQNGKKKL